MAKTCAIIGSGFRGIIAAWLLAKKGYEVTLIEKAPEIGGIMNSFEWNGFFADKGVQAFGSIPKNLGAIVEEVMDGEVVPFDFKKYGSIYLDKVTEGLAIPDLTHISEEEKQKIMYEMLVNITRPQDGEAFSLYCMLERRYGKTAADILDKLMQQVYRISSKQVEKQALRQTVFHRLRFLDDDLANELKKHPEFDKIVSARRKVLGEVDDYVSLYPAQGGMKAFCKKIKEKLEKMNVRILTCTVMEDLQIKANKALCKISNAEQSEFDHVFFAQDHGLLAQIWRKDDRITNNIHSTPMMIYLVAVKPEDVNDYNYLHQYTLGSLVFRASANGIYSNQVREDGYSFISIECPTEVDSDLWNNPDDYFVEVWKEVTDMNLVKPGTQTPAEFKAIGSPVTHKMAKIGTTELIDELDREIENTNGVIVMPNRDAFIRRELMWSVEEAVEKMCSDRLAA